VLTTAEGGRQVLQAPHESAHARERERERKRGGERGEREIGCTLVLRMEEKSGKPLMSSEYLGCVCNCVCVCLCVCVCN
jgi:hypothetical protein